MTQPEHQQYRNWTPPVAPVGRTIKHPKGWAIAVALSLVLSCLLGIIVGNGTADAPTTRTAGGVPTVVASPGASHRAPAPHPAPSPGKPAVGSSFGDGTWQVGHDITAGTYTTTVPADSINCYWARQKDASGELESVIANDDLDAGARGTITVKTTDHYVKSSGCGTWKRR